MTGPPAQGPDSHPPGLRIIRGTDDLTVAEALSRQVEYLAGELTRMEARLPTAEECDCLRKRKLEDDRASWAWQVIKTHAPWVSTALAMCGAVAYWVLTHTISVAPKP